MRYEITLLQEAMKRNNIQIYYVSSGDPHGSEFVHDYFKCCEYLSGFSGENATLIVAPQSALLWTDGRFFLQAEQELAGSGITLMKTGEPDVPSVNEFLISLAESTLDEESGEFDGFVLGFDGNTVQGEIGMQLEDELEEFNVEILSDNDLVGEVLEELSEEKNNFTRPLLESHDMWEFPLKYAGESSDSKLARVREIMKSRQADYLLVSDLMEIAWLFNLRGSDIRYTPVFYSYALVGMNQAELFVRPEALDSARGMFESSEPNVKVKDYDEIFSAVSGISAGETIWYDPASTCYNLCYAAGNGVGLIEETSPVQELKAAKNPVELSSTLDAHTRDGAAMLRFLRKLNDCYFCESGPDYSVFDDYMQDPELADDSHITELGLARYLDKLRREAGAFDLSFETISAYGPDGAIIHYTPSAECNADVLPEGFLLLDSGGQYPSGTTDITRTVATGPLTQEMIDNYTYVLKSHITMARAVVKPGETGRWLDDTSREPLRRMGLDFNHGLSHGVGHVLGVHEPPAVMSRTGEPRPLIPGMIMSDEPGLYFENKYGIRIENEVYCRQNEDGSISLDTITFCPYEKKAINIKLLTDEEIDWINSYHRKVRDRLSPLLDDEDLAFLDKACEEIQH